jgi:hypothetical protein
MGMRQRGAGGPVPGCTGGTFALIGTARFGLGL